MNDDRSLKARVGEELERVREHVRGLDMDQIRSGAWFETLVRHALRTYAEEATPEFFERKYSGLNRDAIVDRRIDLAQRYAALAGGVTATGYSAAVVATLGTKGGASPYTLPAAVTAFMTDLYYVSSLQLRLAYDLSVLYEQPVNMDDPEDLIDFIHVAFGVKAAEAFQNAVGKAAPEAARLGVKQVVTGGALHWLQALPVVGKHLLQRNVIKMAIPAVAIPVSTGINYFNTGRVAKAARKVYRDRAFISERAAALTSDETADPLLLMEAIALVVGADGMTAGAEAQFLQSIADGVGQDGSDSPLAAFRGSVDRDEEDVLRRISQSEESTRKTIYEAAAFAAIADRKLHRKEEKQLQRLAGAAGIAYDRTRIEEMQRRLEC